MIEIRDLSLRHKGGFSLAIEKLEIKPGITGLCGRTVLGRRAF